MESYQLGPGTKLIVVPQRKFKTTILRVHLLSDLDDGVTSRNVIAAVLGRGTRRYPTVRQLHAELDSLYGTAFVHDVAKIGDWQLNFFVLSMINDRYVPGGGSLLTQGRSLLWEILFDPVTRNGLFPVPAVEGEKENLRRALESQISDKAQYALLRHTELMFEGEPYGRNVLGRKEDLPSLEARTLWDRYCRFVREAPLTVLVGGDVEPQRMQELCARFGEGRKSNGTAGRRSALVPPEGTKQHVEEMALSQARLCIGYRHGAVIGDQSLPAVEVMTGLLGGFPHAFLFQWVREKESLAYSVHAFYDQTKGVLCVTAGIDPDSFGRVLDIVGRAVAELARGAFSAEDLAATKAGLIRRLRASSDNLNAMLREAYLYDLFGTVYAPQEEIAAIERVRAEDVARAASGLSLDTIYLLRPESLQAASKKAQGAGGA